MTLPQMRLHCDRCPACCKSVRVPVTHCDLSRLVTATELAVEQLVDWLGPDEIDMSGEPESFVELNVGRRLLVLRHEGGGCRFLLPAGRCEIYEARPAPCAAYPFSIERSSGEAQLELLSDAPCDRSAAFARITEPRNELDARCAVTRVETELSEYLQRVREWNRRQHRRKLAHRAARNAAAFFVFLCLGVK